MNENDPATRVFVVKHAVELHAYFGRPASELTSHQIHEWARIAEKPIDASVHPQRAVAEQQSPLQPMVDLAALEARIQHEALVKVFDRNLDGQLELLPAFLGEVEMYVLGRVQRVERGQRPLTSPVPVLGYAERSPDQQAILRRLAMDTAHAFLAIRFPLHVASVEGFRLLERVDTEIALWFLL